MIICTAAITYYIITSVRTGWALEAHDCVLCVCWAIKHSQQATMQQTKMYARGACQEHISKGVGSPGDS